MSMQLNINKKTNYDSIEQFRKKECSIEELLIFCSSYNCSDLFIKEYDRPYISRYGKIQQIPCLPISRDIFMTFYDLYVKEEMNAFYVRNKMLDTSVEVRIPENNENFGKYSSNYFRYRANFGFSEGKRIITFRMIRPEPPMFENINYPKQVEMALKDGLSQSSGLTLLSAATGSGKTTTIASAINSFTKSGEILDNKVMITLEEPIEYVYNSTESFKINQKEMGKDFIDYPKSLKSAMREHPNIIFVGEIRDRETVNACIEASKTGHTTISTFHAETVAACVARLMFHLENSKDLAYDLILNTNIIISQRLIPSDDKYIVDTQYLLFTDEIRKYLLKVVDEEMSLQAAIMKLFDNEELKEKGILKDWSYSKSHV